nr:hypothetical protein [Mucilaginibacter sp. X4EP1]
MDEQQKENNMQFAEETAADYFPFLPVRSALVNYFIESASGKSTGMLVKAKT